MRANSPPLSSIVLPDFATLKIRKQISLCNSNHLLDSCLNICARNGQLIARHWSIRPAHPPKVENQQPAAEDSAFNAADQPRAVIATIKSRGFTFDVSCIGGTSMRRAEGHVSSAIRRSIFSTVCMSWFRTSMTSSTKPLSLIADSRDCGQ